jgi:hypothetical protein
MMVDTDLGAANTREKRFHVIRANAFVGISPFVIDALREEAIVEHISQCGASSAWTVEPSSVTEAISATPAGLWNENLGDGLAALLASHDQAGDEIAGFALVVWDNRGDMRTAYDAARGPIGPALVLTLVSDALNRHLAIKLAEEQISNSGWCAIFCRPPVSFWPEPNRTLQLLFPF